jgi:hypothetical protein
MQNLFCCKEIEPAARAFGTPPVVNCQFVSTLQRQTVVRVLITSLECHRSNLTSDYYSLDALGELRSSWTGEGAQSDARQ